MPAPWITRTLGSVPTERTVPRLGGRDIGGGANGTCATSARAPRFGDVERVAQRSRCSHPRAGRRVHRGLRGRAGVSPASGPTTHEAAAGLGDDAPASAATAGGRSAARSWSRARAPRRSNATRTRKVKTADGDGGPARAYQGPVQSGGHDPQRQVRRRRLLGGDGAIGQATDQTGRYVSVSASGFHTCAAQANGERRLLRGRTASARRRTRRGPTCRSARAASTLVRSRPTATSTAGGTTAAARRRTRRGPTSRSARAASTPARSRPRATSTARGATTKARRRTRRGPTLRGQRVHRAYLGGQGHRRRRLLGARQLRSVDGPDPRTTWRSARAASTPCGQGQRRRRLLGTQWVRPGDGPATALHPGSAGRVRQLCAQGQS